MDRREITLADAAEEYLKEKAGHILPHTLDDARRQLEFWLEAMGTNDGLRGKDGLMLVDVLTSRLKKYVAEISARCTPNTVRYKLSQPAGVLNWLVCNGYLLLNPMKRVQLPPLKHAEKVVYTHEEYLRIRKACEGSELHWLVTCAYRTGLSMVDICNLRWESVDLKNLIIITNRQKLKRKGGGRVYIPILPGSDLHQGFLLLKEAPVEDAWPGPGYVHHGLALIYQSNEPVMMMRYRRFLKELGINKKFKDWRNTFISGLANSGVATAIGCKISGHSNPAQFAA
jgi:integrase